MKFQNPILNLLRTEGWTDGRTDKSKAICPFNFFKVGGIKIMKFSIELSVGTPINPMRFGIL